VHLPRIYNLKVDDEIYLEKIPYGFLTLARYQLPLPKDLWLLGTGTGLAPFISMLQDFETWSKYESITLVYSVRTASELAYATRIKKLQRPLVRAIQALNLCRLLPVIRMRHCMTAYLY
jgi:ferredoxin-NADP reductase